MTASPAGLRWLNEQDPEAAAEALRAVCSADAWVRDVLAGRPYATPEALHAANTEAMERLTETELDQALAGHPPIGRPRDAKSAGEQRGMADATDELRERVAELNQHYQDRFGHVFLICASGLTARQLHDALTERLAHTPEVERRRTREELTRINRLRLERLLHEGAEA
ncbi:2-oxo-4-hydroxy-4-carboxy-5-ureidoimidazoline decarboxylase [Streptomyces sp. NPDC005438]|uniref:2-oxo-4-hydroxy-4-carboxy-5-ureidoimidazoline decarboxylase n=1 Tax=Streptomyces sp. NPDC005438 TaxID=3156880 RepID=UPI0033B933DB